MLYFNDLEHAGVPQGVFLNKSGSGRFQLDKPEAYMPVNLEHQPFDLLARHEGLDSSVAEFKECYRLSEISEWEVALLACPDLLTALQNAARNSHIHQTHCNIVLEISRLFQNYTCNYD